MIREDRQRIAQETAATLALANQCLVIRYLSSVGSNIRDPKKFNLDAQENGIEITHLALDGAGGGIFSISWDINKEFLKAFTRSQKEFLTNQHYRYPYQISPPPAIAELLVSCDYIRPVFDIDLWDEGVFATDSTEYDTLRKRILYQIMTLFSIFKRLFPSNVDETPVFTDDGSIFTMPDSIPWRKLDMAILESPCKPIVKEIQGRGRVHGIKHSFHLRFPFVRVKKVLMYGINAFLTNRLDAECPRIIDIPGQATRLANTWCEALDAKIIQTGIKLPGSQKATKCPQCLDILERERNEEKLAKAKRQIAQSQIIPNLKNRTRSNAPITQQPSTNAASERPVDRSVHIDDDKTLNLNNPFVQALNKEDLQKIILSLSANATTSTQTKYGPSRCGQYLCANMRLYDGRFHTCLGIVDSLTQPQAALSAHRIQDLLDPIKSAEFARNEVRQLWMLQARTQFHTSNLCLDERIQLSDYSNMYDPSVRTDINRFLKRSQPARTRRTDADHPPTQIDLETPMTDQDLFVHVMSQSFISQTQREAALKIVRSFDVHYASMEISRFYWYETGLCLIPLGNEAGRYCLNKMSCHNSSTMRFIFRINRHGHFVVIPYCFCSKEVASAAHNKTCRQFYYENSNKLAKPIDFDTSTKIFAPFFQAKRSRESVGSKKTETMSPGAASAMMEESTLPVHETVAEMIARSSSKRSRKVSVRTKLVTGRESRQIDSTFRSNQPFTIDESSIPSSSLQQETSHTLQHLLIECQAAPLDRMQTPANGFSDNTSSATPEHGWASPVLSRSLPNQTFAQGDMHDELALFLSQQE